MRLRIVAALVAAAVTLAGCSAAPPDRPDVGTTAAQSSSGAPATTSTAAVPPAAVAPTPTPTPTPTPRALPNPCSGNTSAQLVKVQLAVQHLWLCERDHLAYSTPITSGIPGGYTSTPTGTYTVQALTRNTQLTLNTGRTYDVKYWIPFDAPLFGFHDSSWQDFPYGARTYRTRGSHGCVHMPLKAIAFLYRWADVGAKVRIRA